MSVLSLTFDLHRDSVPNAADLIDGHADVVPRVLLRHGHNTQSFIEVLDLHLLRQVPAFLNPLDAWSRAVRVRKTPCDQCGQVLTAVRTFYTQS